MKEFSSIQDLAMFGIPINLMTSEPQILCSYLKAIAGEFFLKKNIVFCWWLFFKWALKSLDSQACCTERQANSKAKEHKAMFQANIW